jgi:hypothetical protein
MLKLARAPRLLAVLTLFAAAASTAPLVRWCPLPWSEVTVEDFVACDTGESACETRCEAECESRALASDSSHGCPNESAPEGDRAYCLEDPVAGARGPASPAIDPPAVLAVIVSTDLPPEPECVASRFLPAETARPRSRPPGLPPPVRGPPCVA